MSPPSSNSAPSAPGTRTPAQTPPGTRTIATGYVPRPLQARLHVEMRRFSVLVAHRRFGKTVFCINDLIDAALKCPLKRPRMAYIAPFRNQAKSIAWPYLKDYTSKIPGTEPNEAELKVTLYNGAEIQLFGSDNPDALRGNYFDKVVFDEYAQHDSRVWGEIIRPALTDRRGSAVFIGTPNGHDSFYNLYQYSTVAAKKPGSEWFAAMFKASETGIISPDELAEARASMAAETGNDDSYQQEFECSFDAAIKGAYFGKLISEAEKEGRICNLPHDPLMLVHTAWDLGVGDSTVIWFFQHDGRYVRMIDYYENHGEGMEHYIKHIRRKPYVYGTHFAPHDAKVKEWGSGKTRIEQALSLGVHFKIVPKVTVEDGINAVRVVLHSSVFDMTRCKDGIEALKLYRQGFDPSTKAFSGRPVHGPESHACFPAGTKVDTPSGPVAIENMRAGDRIILLGREHRVSAAGVSGLANTLAEVTLSDGRILRSTKNHPFMTRKGLVTADALRYGDEIILNRELASWKDRIVLFSMASIFGLRRTVGIVTTCGTSLPSGSPTLCGSTVMAPFRKAFTSIISTMTRRTTGWKTCSYLRRVSTAGITGGLRFGRLVIAMCGRYCPLLGSYPTRVVEPPRNVRRLENGVSRRGTLPNGGEPRGQNGPLKKPVMPLGPGTPRQKELRGTPRTARERGIIGSGLLRTVASAVRSIRRLIPGSQSFAAVAVERVQLVRVAWQPVYNLTIPKHHLFAVEGVVVGNSDSFRYLALGYRNEWGGGSNAPVNAYGQPTLNELLSQHDHAGRDKERRI